MFNRVVLRFFGIVVVGAFAFLNLNSSAYALTGCKPAGLPGGVLYKGENVHGGRGRSLILGCNTYHNIRNLSWNLQILDRKGRQVGTFRLWDPGHRPYGRRYYAYGTANRNIPAYVKVGNACWTINNLGSRQGYVSAISGTGGC